MTEQLYDAYDEEPQAAVVHWMEPRRMTTTPLGASAAIAGAFALGAGLTLGVLAVLHWLGPERQPPPLRRRLH